MNKAMKYFVFLSLLLLLSAFLGDRNSAVSKPAEQIKTSQEETILYWTCGMHPSVRVSPEEYERGQTKCPICNMDLVPVHEGGAPEKGSAARVTLSPRAERLANVKTLEVSYLPLSKEIRTIGRIDYDERGLAYAASRVSGRIDKLFIDFTGVDVREGDPLIWIYSPALISTQEEYLIALATWEKIKESQVTKVVENAESLVQSARRRLLFWGISEKQIEELKRKGKAETHMVIYAPISGTVIYKTAVEGKYVKEGENIYHIADLSGMWMLADIYEEDISLVKVGQDVQITSMAFPGEVLQGRISFVNPYLDPKTRTVKIRVDIPNPERKLKPEMYVDALIMVPIGGTDLGQAKSGLVLAVPKSAVLDVGRRKLAYISKGNGEYEAREIEVGPEAETTLDQKRERFYPVLKGLAEGEKVVTRANFLIDSQSQLTGEAAGAYGGALEVE